MYIVYARGKNKRKIQIQFVNMQKSAKKGHTKRTREKHWLKNKGKKQQQQQYENANTR